MNGDDYTNRSLFNSVRLNLLKQHDASKQSIINNDHTVLINWLIRLSKLEKLT